MFRLALPLVVASLALRAVALPAPQTSTTASTPTSLPTSSPTSLPTPSPTTFPTSIPTTFPTTFPTTSPTSSPTGSPTSSPTGIPTSSPTVSPTSPTTFPTSVPTSFPTSVPTTFPTSFPTSSPTGSPTSFPTSFPTSVPTSSPTGSPTSSPTTFPTSIPTSFPTSVPTSFPTTSPTGSPTSSPFPTTFPTSFPTSSPTSSPFPTTFPTSFPTSSPTRSPTTFPTTFPTSFPTSSPTGTTTSFPTTFPTTFPTSFPTSSSTGTTTTPFPTPSPTTGNPTTVSPPPTSVPVPTQTYEPPAPPNPTTVPETAPYTPAGGLETNATAPLYRPLSDYDFQSLTLALYQQYIELDVFRYALSNFTDMDFEDAGLTADDRYLIQFMADQEVAHTNMLANIIGLGVAAGRCNYTYPFTTVRDFLDFSAKLLAWGESGVYGFLEHLDSRAAANLLLQSVATEARQQQILRQFEGLFPMPVNFGTGISQSMAWTLLAPYITNCPVDNTLIAWQNFPALNITNNPNASTLYGLDVNGPAITHNRSVPLSKPGFVVGLSWESPGGSVGPNGSYTTNTTATGPPAFVAWISQLNTTYTNLTMITNSSGATAQPQFFNIINGTTYLAIVDDAVPITPANISALNDHILAGPAVFQAG